MSKTTTTTDPSNTLDVANCICANLRKAARAVTQEYDAALRPAGLKPTQFTLLATLTRQGGTPLTQLADIMGMDRTTLTRNLKPLIRRELIHIAREGDQRVRKVTLTDNGAIVFEQALSLWQDVQKRISDKLDPEKWTDFLDTISLAVSAARTG